MVKALMQSCPALLQYDVSWNLQTVLGDTNLQAEALMCCPGGAGLPLQPLWGENVSVLDLSNPSCAGGCLIVALLLNFINTKAAEADEQPPLNGPDQYPRSLKDLMLNSDYKVIL